MLHLDGLRVTMQIGFALRPIIKPYQEHICGFASPYPAPKERGCYVVRFLRSSNLVCVSLKNDTQGAIASVPTNAI